MTQVTEPEPDADLAGRATALYLAGYGPIPIRTGQKAPEPGGFQGQKSPMPTFDTWWSVVAPNPGQWGNLGVRLPALVVGVDVDAYDTKGGRAAWEELTRPEPFPATVIVSARFGPGYDGLSGIRLYRLPAGVDQAALWGAHDGIELIRFGHRYLLAPGSDHPGGTQYRAFDMRRRAFLDYLPPAHDLPELSPSQAGRLTKTGAPWAPVHEAPVLAFPQEETPARAPSTGAGVPGPPEPREVPSRGMRAAVVPCPFLQRLADDAVRDLRTGSSRHDRMTQATYAIVAAAAEGHRGEDNALYQVGRVFIDEVAGDREGGTGTATAELRRAIDQARDKIRPVAAMLQACCPGEPTDPAALGDSLWDARAWLAWCDRTGRARGVSRWSLVGALLARVSAEISPQVKVDSPISAGGTEINLFCFLLGGSGTGKSSANRTVRQAWAWSAGELRLGSGEGLAAAYTKRESVKDLETNRKESRPVRHEWRRYAWVDEYASLMALKDRAGATIASELRSAWSGERLGYDYRAEETRLPVEAGTYRLAIAAGIQPALAPDVFNGAEVGDLQRWLWFSAVDPVLAQAQPGPFRPLTETDLMLPTQVASNAVDMTLHNEIGALMMPIEAGIRDEIWTSHLTRQSGGGNDADAHRNQTRLRLAGVLALMDGRLSVAGTDWALAGDLVTVSDSTRAGVQKAIALRSRDVLRARGAANAEIAAGEADANAKRVAGVVSRAVAKHGRQNRKQLRNRLDRETSREHLIPALDLAVSLGWLVEIPVSDAAGRPGTAYEKGSSWPG